MFCSNCGNKLENGANFCSKCGYKIGSEIIHETISPEIPLKQENFELREFDYSSLSNYNHKKIDEGELTLYSNRLVFIGSKKIQIPLNEIINVSVEYEYGYGMLLLKIQNGGFCFLIKTKGAVINAFVWNPLVATALDKKNPSLEYWREEIEKQRIQLLQNPQNICSYEESEQNILNIKLTETGEWICPTCGAKNPKEDKRCWCGFKK